MSYLGIDYLKIVLRHGLLVRFEDIFTHVESREFFKYCGLNPYGPAEKRLKDLGKFTVGEIRQMGEMLECDWKIIARLIDASLSA
jgi:hypothetical protein